MMKKLSFISVIFLITSVFIYGQDGKLDPTFGINGITTTEIGSGSEYYNDANSIAIQKNDKIVVAGFAFNGSHTDFAVARFEKNGILDTDFGQNGIVYTKYVSTSNEEGRSVAIQPDGKIVVGGYTNYGNSNHNFALIRYNTNASKFIAPKPEAITILQW